MTNILDNVEQNYTFTIAYYFYYFIPTNKTFVFCFECHYKCIYGVNPSLMNQYKKKINPKRI